MLLSPKKEKREQEIKKTLTDSKFYSIPNYEVYRKDRIGMAGGELCVYVKNSIHVKRRIDLETDDAEIIWLETCPTNRNDLYLSGEFTDLLHQRLLVIRDGKNIENISLLGREIVLLGDINIDYLCTTKFKNHTFTKVLKSLNLSQLMNVITRPLSRTCLDHIWCTHAKRLKNVKVLNIGISDTLP